MGWYFFSQNIPELPSASAANMLQPVLRRHTLPSLSAWCTLQVHAWEGGSTLSSICQTGSTSFGRRAHWKRLVHPGASAKLETPRVEKTSRSLDERFVR